MSGLNKNKLEDGDFTNMISFFCLNLWVVKQRTDIKGYKCYNFYRTFPNRRAKRYSGYVVLYIIKVTIEKGINIVKNHFDIII